jgi:hypothetical protein
MPETTAKPPKRPAKAKTAISQGIVLSTATNALVVPAIMGTPTKYNQAIADAICVRISQGESLRSIVKDGEMPSQSVVYLWLQQKPDFLEQYTRAREEQADTLADEIVDIADERPEVNELIDKKTGEVLSIDLSSSYIAWQKNRIEARKWTAMKLRPKKYGDKLELGGDPNNPLKFEVKIEAEQNLAELVKHAELKRQAANAE